MSALRHGKYPFILTFLIPPVGIYALYMLSPYVQAIYISLTEWSGLSANQKFIGFDNYVEMWNDDQLRTALRNNLILLVVVPVLTLVLGLFFASMLNVGGRGRSQAITGVRGSSIYKVVYFFPQVLPHAIVAIMFAYVFAPSNAGGILNNILEAIGLGSLTQLWLGEPKYLIWIVVLVMTWAFVGFYVVLFSAAMQSIPRDIYEAALLDGSSRLTTFRKVTLPLVWDTVQVGWVYMAIQAMDGFAIVHIMLGVNGGVQGAGDVLGVAIYRAAFADYDFGYAAAIGVLMLALTMTIVVLFMRVLRRERVELA
ncbi:N-acetylglucosamine transport system permease protein [Haloactinopolyspora alba]|uniref:N-acetylglucosamine transport system permease protein n=1 Tax=Haloactinopolyspora alba TaxID=648780 RepID=A0A2P8DY99_9ACTN|nr:sugar ABC transporter permease [Haloactinopolyspora alba]PSL02162.1 N-acetylglucosamine transport system permease protein [Haloactinopolyspora alba]